MRFSAFVGLGLALMLQAVSPAAAQEWDVARRTFRFLGSRLTIDVQPGTAGSLQIMRGRHGELEVAGRAIDGFAAFSLAGVASDELMLSGVGAQQVQYLVVVPEKVYVRVRLPDRPVAEVFGSLAASGSYRWEATPAVEVRAEPQPAPSAEQPAEIQGMFTTYAGALPTLVRLPDPAALRTVTIRMEGTGFRVAASRPLVLENGDPRVLEIRPHGEPMDVVIVVPRAVRDFVVQVGPNAAFAVIEGRARALCSPVMEQKLQDDRRWFTFTPNGQALECSADAAATARKAG